jgi:hypothetical protein
MRINYNIHDGLTTIINGRGDRIVLDEDEAIFLAVKLYRKWIK